MIAADDQKDTLNSGSTQVLDSSDLERLKFFLESNKLPFKDIKLGGNIFILYRNNIGNIVGSVGLEIYSEFGLIRSIAVHHSERGRGLGKKMVDEILRCAKQRGLASVYLLTENAHDFFLKKGFQDISRDDVPDAVRASSEFLGVCPITAKCMIFKI